MASKVSVIIPFYNGVNWLFDAVESVLKQTHDNFEIIVVNDGSPENVDSFLLQYKNKIIYLYKENGGPASARNLALKVATGEYIAFLDSDDVWLPDKTNMQLSFMNISGAEWSHTGYFNWYPEDNKTVLKNNADDYGDVYLKSFISLRANTPAIIIKKKLIDQHSDFVFTENMRIGEDSTLWTRIAKHYPLALVEEPLIKVRQRGTNADLSSLSRFQSKAVIYNDIKRGVHMKLPFIIIFIFSIYNLGAKAIGFFDSKTDLNKNQLEYLGKIMWVGPFLLERIYLLFLKKHRISRYKLKWKPRDS